MLFLYDKNTTDFTTNGEPIHHVYDAHVKRDEGFYLEFKLVLDEAKEYQSIKEEMIISAMTPDGINYFRVYEVNPKSDHVEVIALQLFYYLDHRLVKPFKLTNASGQSAIQTFKSNFVSDVQPYTFSSSVPEKHDFQASTSETEENYLNALEVINRIATRYDSEFLLNGFDVRMVKRLGQRTNALLYEKKNISSFELDCNINSLVTRIHAKSKWTIGHDEPGYVEKGNNDREISVVVDSPLINEYSQIYEREYVNNNCRTEQELINWAKLKYSTNNIDKPRRSIQMKTNIIDDTPINYGDELVLKYLVHDIDEVIRCVGYDYDPIGKQFYEVTLGDWRDDFGTTISQTVTDVSERQKAQQELIKQTVNIVQSATNGINRIAYGPEPVPNPIDGDIWFKYTLDRPNDVTLWIYNAELGRWEDKTPVNERIDKAIEEVFQQVETEKQATQESITEAIATAKAEAERLDSERQLIIDGKFEEVNNANEALEQSIATAEQNAQNALTKAGASESLAQSAKEASDTAIANVGTVTTELGKVKTQASDSLAKAQEALNATGTLSTQVQSYEETVDGYKSEVANYSLTNKTLTAKVKSYEETVDGYSQSLTRVEGKFDNLEIGGRNLLTGTSKEEQEVKSASWQIGYWNPSLIIGEEYTFSFDIKSENATYLQSVFLNYSNSGYASNTPITKEWTRVSFTFKWNGGEYLGREISAHIYPRPDYSGTYVSKIKLEKGNVATDWTPAPEDMVNNTTFTTYQNQVKSTTDEHTRRLTALDGDGGRVSKVEQTATQIQRSLSNYAQTTYVDTKITEKAGEITTNLSKVETLASNGLKGRNLLVTRDAISRSYLVGSETYPNPSPDNDGYGTDTSIVLIPVQAGEKYTLSKITGNTQYFRISFLDENKNYVNRITSSLDKQTITIPERSRFMWVSYPRNAKPMIELGSEKSEYQEAYDDRVSSVEFQTVKETTSLYERIIGKTENNISTNVSRIAMTSDLFQVAVGDIGNLVKNGNFRDGSTYGWDIDRNRLNNSDVRANGWYATTKVRDTYATYEVDVVPNETLNVEFRAWSYISQPFTVGFRFYDQYGEHVVWAGIPSVNLSPTPTVYRGTFKVPDRAVKGIPWVTIQKLSDFDTVFFNSVRISRSPSVDQVNSRFTQTREAINLGLYGDKDAISEVGIVKSGVRIKGNLITLDGQVNMTSSFIVPEGNIGNLSAGKITSGTIDTARLNATDIVTKGLTTNVVKSTHILATEALFTKLFANRFATDKLATQEAWIKSSMIGEAQIGTAHIGQIDASNGRIVNLDASSITSGTMTANRISGGTLTSTNGATSFDLNTGQFSFQQDGVAIKNQFSGRPLQYLAFKTGTYAGSRGSYTALMSNSGNSAAMDENSAGIQIWNNFDRKTAITLYGNVITFRRNADVNVTNQIDIDTVNNAIKNVNTINNLRIVPMSLSGTSGVALMYGNDAGLWIGGYGDFAFKHDGVWIGKARLIN